MQSASATFWSARRTPLGKRGVLYMWRCGKAVSAWNSSILADMRGNLEIIRRIKNLRVQHAMRNPWVTRLGLKLWELCNELLLIRLRRSAGQKMLWSKGPCVMSCHIKVKNWMAMSIKLSWLHRKWLVRPGN